MDALQCHMPHGQKTQMQRYLDVACDSSNHKLCMQLNYAVSLSLGTPGELRQLFVIVAFDNMKFAMAHGESQLNTEYSLDMCLATYKSEDPKFPNATSSKRNWHA